MACFIRNHRECQRALTCAIVVLLVGTAALLLPRAARAEVVTSYKGWGWVQQPLGIAVPGWSWNSTGQAWSFRSLPSGTQVYLWPWSSDWEWVWTQDSGWLAVPMTYAMSPAAPTTAALLWSDEFGAAAGTGPSATDWNIQTGAFGYGGEACFTGANVKHNGVGQLAIITKREASCGGRLISSSSLDGKRQFGPPAAGQTITYEARAKGACGSGLWPAFWAVGTERAWPLDGEIDMIELFGKNPGNASQTIHGAKTDGSHWQLPYATKSATPWCSSYHVYGARWSQNRIAFTIDGAVTKTFEPSSLSSGWEWPFNNYRENLRLTVAAGAYSGTVDYAALPSTWLVDYVRVYG